jgi:hypothetical protein
MNKKEMEPHRRWRNKKGGGEKRMIETDGAIRKSSIGKWQNVEEEGGECDR